MEPLDNDGAPPPAQDFVQRKQEAPMFTPELACLDLQECRDLPPGTLIAPLRILREIRCALGPTALKLMVGDHDQEAVLVSTDLYRAFHKWEEAQPDLKPEAGDDHDPTLLN